MNKPALLKLAQLLRKPLPKGVDRFEMRSWQSHKECGTSACAVGLAASDPWFNKRGFKIMNGGPGFIPERGCYLGGWNAVIRFFDLTEEDAFYLFAKPFYIRGNRLDVARRIEGFVRRGK